MVQVGKQAGREAHNLFGVIRERYEVAHAAFTHGLISSDYLYPLLYLQISHSCTV